MERVTLAPDLVIGCAACHGICPSLPRSCGIILDTLRAKAADDAGNYAEHFLVR